MWRGRVSEGRDRAGHPGLLGPLRRHRVGGGQGEQVPAQLLSRVVLQVGQVVGQGAPVQRVAVGTDSLAGRRLVAPNTSDPCFASREKPSQRLHLA